MWIEAITVRTASPEQCTALLDELADFQQKKGRDAPEWFACYQNLDVKNEISIHLAWDEKVQRPGKTDFGRLIARRLDQHGLVHHTLWKRAMGTSEAFS